MSQIEQATTNPIDITFLTDELPAKMWKCPHCGNRQKKSECADDNLILRGIHLEHCGRCGHVHMWRLRFTKEMTQKICEAIEAGLLEVLT